MSDDNRHPAFVQQYTVFIAHHANKPYREPLTDLYEHTYEFLKEFLEGKQSLPYIRFGATASRLLSDLTEHTGYGANWEVTINPGLAVTPNPAWVVNDWPAPDLRLFIRHLVERQLVRQYVWEVEGVNEASHGGFGPRFCAHANRISAVRGRAQVISRRREAEDQNEFLGKFWPHRPELNADPYCYGDDLTQTAIDLAAGTTNALRTKAAPPSLGLLELFLGMLNAGKCELLRKALTGHIERLQRERLGRKPKNAKAELGETDIDGSPLSIVGFHPAWLDWENGIVRKVAESIDGRLSFAELPILADALEEAGCQDGRILRHLRERMEHTRQCWALRGLLKSAEQE